MDETTIRRLTEEDVDIFRAMRLEALRTEPAAYASTAADWEKLSADEWRTRLTQNTVFAAFWNDAPVGIMGLMRQGSSKMAHRATLIMVYVRAEARGTGIARALLEAVKSFAGDNGIRQIELAVSAENPAAASFYKRAGFSQIGCVPGGILHEGREIDDIMMACRVDAEGKE
ncbi:GNAT family N-acetyltransferase [Agrobacterium fabrum]|uniref:GNAT family N-acetyltransferase n=1 Tax=Agrobacterium fabrum TaxID=1176649 RepID=UPI002473195A|nr:GNAT family N-acetyltransferase [Agrobacterium fabrum]MDH6295805.1 ribosomal protein S18 acetylase RimI-like enzyme [Agrobacterium fabrum]